MPKDSVVGLPDIFQHSFFIHLLTVVVTQLKPSFLICLETCPNSLACWWDLEVLHAVKGF